jgi:hypothetical protein
MTHLVFVVMTAFMSMMAAAEHSHPKQFDAADRYIEAKLAERENHHEYHPRRFLAGRSRKGLALVDSKIKSKKSKGPWDWNTEDSDDDEFEYGEHAEDEVPIDEEYDVSHFINTKETAEDDDDDEDNDDDTADSHDHEGDDSSSSSEEVDEDDPAR